MPRTNSLPPSAHAARLALAYRGPLTYGDLQAETGLDERTLDRALAHLRTSGVVAADRAADDLRKTRYRLATDASEG